MITGNSRSESRREQVIRAAWLYHERGLNQQAVANRLGISRSTVSRLLSDAEHEGIVRVIVTEPLPETASLADDLIERFELSGATVEFTLDSDLPRDAAATALARRLESMVASGPMTIAAGWGRTLGTAAQRVRPMVTHGVTVVDAFGHTTTADIAPAVEVSNTLAHKFDADVIHIPSPGFAPQARIADTFYEADSVSSTLDVARRADCVVISIGVVGTESLLHHAGYLDSSAMERVIRAGGVGEIFGRYYDRKGNRICTDVLHPISLTFEDLGRCQRVIAAVGGVDKTAAVLGALAAGVIDELAIDHTLARALLDASA
ncbi:MAG: hypothetical protein CSA55_04825 [Ilumatobacter coccineus]|uniref:HTH cro/C1-type domain-containing protein n=1 Tax=Ilumatobacter coccineus TaxID=467094 RepID=A0A2G6K839_9ACTN|nr:MAG: hypothetical protein CSA55_04825 [Ilumatobacter coccineus]